MFDTLKRWDREMFVYLNNLGIEKFDDFWIFVTQIESWTPLFIFFTFLIFYFYKRKKGSLVFLLTVLTFLITLFFTDFVKDFVGRLRPNNDSSLTEFIRALQRPTTFSFFSGHASSSFAITTFLVLILRTFSKWVYLFYLWPILFVTSRIYVGVHYPSDILVGVAVGVFFAFVGYFISEKILKKL